MDMQLSRSQLAKKLGLVITDSAIEKWERNQTCPTERYRSRFVEFLGFDPEVARDVNGSSEPVPQH